MGDHVQTVRFHRAMRDASDPMWSSFVRSIGNGTIADGIAQCNPQDGPVLLYAAETVEDDNVDQALASPEFLAKCHGFRRSRSCASTESRGRSGCAEKPLRLRIGV